MNAGFETICPRPLVKGDAVAILSPASIIREEYVEGAVETLRGYGYNPVVMPHALGHSGTYSGTAVERMEDFKSALLDPAVRAILCSRGGYGAVHLLSELDRLPLERDPKWIVGFSDISALHALMARHGIISVHASMAKGLTRGCDDPLNLKLISMLEGTQCVIEGTQCSDYNRCGSATGVMRGGNLAVLDGLVGTPFNDILPGSILVIEDIAEPIYKIERMLFRLKLAGILGCLAGLVVGQFTEYKPDANHASMEEMINRVLGAVDYPVLFDAPIGHVNGNTPWFHNAMATLDVTPTGWRIVSAL